jgi:hypothetical protein
MWQQLGSPPENFRFYKFSDNSNEKVQEMRKINFEENKTALFPGDGK